MLRILGFAFALAVAGASIARAADTDLTKWFMRATAQNVSAKASPIARPDFLPGTSMRAMACRNAAGASMGVWELAKYDRTHRIGLAAATTDACAVAVFRASAPNAKVPDADLSTYSTGRGIHVGSTYESVLATYGGKPQQGSHFIVAYVASVPGETVGEPHKAIKLPQTITIVVDDGHVSAITVYIDLGGEF